MHAPLFNAEGRAVSQPHAMHIEKGGVRRVAVSKDCDGRIVTHLFFPWVDPLAGIRYEGTMYVYKKFDIHSINKFDI